MKIIKTSLKDFEVARAMFSSNTKEQCQIVKKLREDILKGKNTIIPFCDVMSCISNPNSKTDLDWNIANEYLEDKI